ncbi:MAG TPA: hypothetical protein VMG38_16275 [Trebonia sp.]|nr:hypothetical protein [Trebonia sp.]
MKSASGLPGYCDDLLWALDRSDQRGFLEALHRIRQATPGAGRAEVQDAAARLTPLVATIPFWKGSDLAGVAGQVASYCADNSVILSTLIRRAISVMELSAWFAVTLDGKSVPDPEDPGQYQQSLALLGDVLSQPGRDRLPAILELPARPDARAGALAEAWFSCRSWMEPLLYLAQRKDIRATLPDRDRLTAACDAIRDYMVTAEWLHGLLLVLDDETIVVLHRPTGLGYRVTISGVGDNFQLHTLLATALTGKKSRGMIAGKAPSAAEVAAASDGQDLTPAGGIQARFALADAYGEEIWLEGRPAGIPALEGTRVVVLDPPPYPRSWEAGRAYPQMRPSVTVDEILNEMSSAYWLAKVSPLAG